MMATFYPILRSQGDDAESPCPRDQKFASYSEMPSHLNNMTIYMNQASTSRSYLETWSGSSLSSLNCAEIPPVEARSEMVFIPPTSDATTMESVNGQLNAGAGNLVGNSISEDTQVVPRTWLGILDREQSFQCQGLSLSLGTQVQSVVSVPSFQYQYPNLAFPSLPSTHLPTLERWASTYESDESNQSKELRDSEHSGFAGVNHNTVKSEAFHLPTNMHMYGTLSHANTILNSKYLKAVQQMLDEVVNVKMALKEPGLGKNLDESKENDGLPGDQSMLPSSDPIESITNSSSELSPAERQDLQNKKTKLLTMLDEVGRRYKQYCHQMQILVSSFDMVAGHGAAKSYTALACQTISCHFRSLRDAISNQVEVTRKRLGEQDGSLNGQGSIPRLRYVDHQFRQQRAFQQLGVMRHAWRPQRGLPESSVSILRAWLFEHFLHPYPSDSEKILLAKQTGLSRNQVANWFINARVRLWKPMIEDMYKEEFGDSEANSKSSLEDAAKADGENHLATENRLEEFQDSVTSISADSIRQGQVHDFKSIHLSDLENNKPMPNTLLQDGSNGDSITDSRIMKFHHDHRSKMDDHTLYIPRNLNDDGNLMYGISELSGFTVGNQVSLALGLQRHGSDAFSMSNETTHIRGDNVVNSSVGSDAVDYHCLELGKQQDRFGNSHLLHDFVV